MVVDGKVGPAVGMVSKAVFSADSRHVVYFVSSQKQAWAVVDGVDGPKFDGVLGAAVCSKAAVLTDDGALEYPALRGGTLYRVRHVLP